MKNKRALPNRKVKKMKIKIETIINNFYPKDQNQMTNLQQNKK